VLIKAERALWIGDYAKPIGEAPLRSSKCVAAGGIHPIELLPAIIDREEYWGVRGNCMHPAPLQRSLQRPGASPEGPLPLQTREVRSGCGNQNGRAHYDDNQFGKTEAFRSPSAMHIYLMSQGKFERKKQRGNMERQFHTFKR